VILSWSGEDLTRSVPERFAKIVQTAGANPALVDRQRSYSFHEVDRMARQIASCIHQRSISPKEPVAVLSGPSVNRIAGILGILLSGRPYVPLDPTYPANRNRVILIDSGASILITDHFCSAMAAEITGREWLLINPETLSEEPVPQWVMPVISTTDLCAILYTSGSTGKPKGVVHTHGSILYEARNTSLTMGLSTDDRFLQVAPAGSIASLSQTMSAVLSGAVSIPFSLRERGFSDLSAWIGETKATVFSGTPTVFRHLCHECTDDSALNTLRMVRLGGEAVFKSDAKLCWRHCGSRTIFQVAYGSTETGINTVHTLSSSADLPKHSEVLSIGFPVIDKDIRIMNDDLKPATIGQRGEIVIGGPGLSQGYLNRPDLTTEKYLRLHGAPSSLGVFFRSGDIGRYHEFGELEYSGRQDEQVKIHGFRVECGETEAAIMAESSVRECAVNLVNVEGRGILVAYVVLRSGYHFNEPLMRKSLAASLPEFMLPGIFMILDDLPLNPNGKIDKNSLPIPPAKTASAEMNAGMDSPNLEPALAAIWKKLLGIETVGANDNFFHLGGNSLMMLEMVEKVRNRLHKSVVISTFLQNPTIACLSESLRNMQKNSECQVIKLGAQNNKAPLVFIGQGAYIHRIAEAFSSIRPVLYFHLPNYVDLFAWMGNEQDLSIERIAKIYTGLILSHVQTDTVFLAGYSFNGCLAMAAAQQLETAGRRPAVVILLDTQNLQNAVKIRTWIWKWKMAIKIVIKKIYPAAPYLTIAFKDLKSIKFHQGAPLSVQEERRLILSRWASSQTVVARRELSKFIFPISYQRLFVHHYQRLAGQGILFRVTKRRADIFKGKLPDYGWSGYFERGLKVLEYPGTHFDFVKVPVVDMLAKKLAELLGDIKGY
jgi:amino acid adenylation domain-containing protein